MIRGTLCEVNRNRRRGTSDAGASVVEYAGVIVLAAVLLGALVPLISGGRLQATVQGAVCRILHEPDCARYDGGAGGDDRGGRNGGGSDGQPSRPLTTEDYQRQLCDQLDLNCDDWDTSRGLSCNDGRIQQVYGYYQHLFDNHSELQWAGMAKLAGATVYSGTQDLHVLRSMTKSERLRWLGQHVSGLPKKWVDTIANAAGSELEFYEDKFVEMQKRIFMDLGWQHAAYDRGGLAEMRRLAQAGQLSPKLLYAWEDIASGDPERVKRGNTALLEREQHDILQPFYDQMQDRPLGKAVTYMMSVTAESPVPGGEPFRDVVDEVKLPLGITVHAPAPTGNIATFSSRWKWISEDMLPAYTRLLENDTQGIKNTIDAPLSRRANQYRVIPPGLVAYNPKDGVC